MKVLQFIIVTMLIISQASLYSIDSYKDFQLKPSYFEQNKGQYPNEIRYVLGLEDYSYGFTQNTIIVSTPGESAANKKRLFIELFQQPIEPLGKDQKKFKKNYIYSDRIIKAEHFEKLRYTGAFSGIDVECYIKNGKLEFDYILQPHSDPKQIAFRVQGGDRITINPKGQLTVGFSGHEYIIDKPVAYQTINGIKKEVKAGFVLKQNQVGFSLSAYDPGRPLIIDPASYWASLLGGSDKDIINDIEYANGGIYVTGITKSEDFPFIPLVNNITYGWAFVTRLNQYHRGEPEFMTVLMGPGHFYAEGLDLALDADGNIFITGWTYGYDFPSTEGAYRQVSTDTDHIASTIYYTEESGDAFVLKLTSTGDEVVYSTLVGGSRGDLANAIVVDSQGRAIICGTTYSDDFPYENEIDKNREGTTKIGDEDRINPDGFITKLNYNGTDALFSTYMGGISRDFLNDMEIDNDDNIYIAGTIAGSGENLGLYDFPVNPKYFYGGSNSDYVAFALKMDSQNNALFISVIEGEDGWSEGYGIDVDASGNIYLAGTTSSSFFHVTAGAYRTHLAGGYDAFLAKLNPTGDTCLYSTYLGGSENDRAYDVVVNTQNQAHVIGITQSTDFPINRPSTAPQPDHAISYPSPNDDGFVVKFSSSGSTQLYSTFLGGTSTDKLLAGDLYSDNILYAAGHTSSKNLFDHAAFSSDGYDRTLHHPYHGNDGLVTKLYTKYYGTSGRPNTSHGTRYDGSIYDYFPELKKIRDLLCIRYPCDGSDFLRQAVSNTNLAEMSLVEIIRLASQKTQALKSGKQISLDPGYVKSHLETLPLTGLFQKDDKELLINYLTGDITLKEETLVNALNASYLDILFGNRILDNIELNTKTRQMNFMNSITLKFWHGPELPKAMDLKISDSLKSIPEGFELLFPYYTFSFESETPLQELKEIRIDIDLKQKLFLNNLIRPRLLEWDGKSYRDITTEFNKSNGVLSGRTAELKTYIIMDKIEPPKEIKEYIIP